jgi:lipoate-protein ligase A
MDFYMKSSTFEKNSPLQPDPCLTIIPMEKFSPKLNMHIDKLLFTGETKGFFDPPIPENSFVLRFYQWKPYGITIGKFQKNVTSDCMQGIPVIPRLTGGRAVLHTDELTYSVIFNKKSCFYNPSVNLTYLKISKLIVQALNNINIKVIMSPGTLKRDLKSKDSRHCFCYGSTSIWEITDETRKKLVGSAQARSRTKVLQHGSIPISLDHRLLNTFSKWCNFDNYETCMTSINEISDKMSDQPVSPETIQSSIINSFSKYFKEIVFSRTLNSF